MILPTIFVIDTLADGTNNKYYLSLQVQRLQSVLPQLEKAYNDVDKLSNSISKVAYKDLDVTFIYAFMIVKWAAANKLDPMEVAGIIQTESQFNPKAVSKANARGLMQVHKPSWKMDDYFDVEENIKKGAQILWMYKKSNPGNYLDLYSGGAENYEAKVRNNTQKIKKSIIPVKTGG
jgi:soluble lytic murein transglycosylase-like protein